MKRSWLLVLATFISLNGLVGAGVYFVFDQSISQIANETLENWYQAERNEIAQGNILTPVAKNQALLLSSELLKGVKVTTWNGANPETLISFGESFESASNPYSDSTLIKSGFLRRVVSKRLSKEPNTFISFYVYSSTAEHFFWLSLGVLAILINGSITLILLTQWRGHQKRELQRSEFLALAAEAAHDIQSPLMSLNHLVDDNRLSRSTRDNLKLAANSIGKIVEDLNQTRRRTELPAIHALESFSSRSPETPKIEKRVTKEDLLQFLHYRSATIHDGVKFVIEDSSDLGFSVPLGQVALSRAISNLIDNSLDALKGSGLIRVVLRTGHHCNSIEVIDTGCGIPIDKIENIGERGFTWGKTNGTGLGFYSVRETFKKIGGHVSVKSQVDSGTSILISIPRSENGNESILYQANPIAR